MKIITLPILVIAAVLSGCVNLKPKPDRTRVFTLASDVAPVADVVGQPECYVSRVELPGFLEGTRIFYRSANGELDSAQGARWAETPDEALPRAIAMYLQATGKANVRGFYPWSNIARDAVTISVQFERFSANAQGQVEVIAQWQIESGKEIQKEGRYVAATLVWDRTKVADYVAQLNAALVGLAETIAQEL